MKVINFNLKKYRRERRMTQRDLASRAGLNAATVVRLEVESDADPQLSSLESIARVLEVSVVDLLQPDPEIAAQIIAGRQPKYATYSQLFWDKFLHSVAENWTTKEFANTEVLRKKFDAFFDLLDGSERKEFREGVWNDRMLYIVPKPGGQHRQKA